MSDGGGDVPRGDDIGGPSPPSYSSSSSSSSTPLCVGCVGGGQLGRMMALESPRLNVSMKFLDGLVGADCPAAQVVGAESCVRDGGSLYDEAKMRDLWDMGCDVITVEIEHVGVDGLMNMERDGINVQPSGRVIGIIQDKFAQKASAMTREYFSKHDIPLPPYVDISDVDSIRNAASSLGLPLMLKSRRGAYDGRGNTVLRDISDDAVIAALSDLGLTIIGRGEVVGTIVSAAGDGESSSSSSSSSSSGGLLYAEGWVNFHSEVGVMVVRSTTGEVRSYPATTAIQTDSICRVVLVPARNVPESVRRKCEDVARNAVSCLGDGATGVFGVELFLVNNENGLDVLLNEVAPRPHNTGHYTQDACAVSQFENHLRAVCGLPLGSTDLIVGAAAMVNVLGSPSGGIDRTMRGINAAMSMPRAVVHWYGKGYRPGRKMGHINITADSHAELDGPLSALLLAEGISEDVVHRGIGAGARPPPLVGVIMGSHSDLPTMQDAVDVLRDFGVPYEVDVVSAHRTPEKLMTYSRSAVDRGLQVIIAGAGGAAHLPGMVAAMTPLPVIGVPIKTSTLNGQDSLLSIVQMPRGVPVATVAIGNATNAGLLAIRCLCASRPGLRDRMVAYQLDMKNAVDGISRRLLEQGSDKFLEGMGNTSKSVNV
ncbi:hypothetical protein ACHAXA_010890 [Cyclostephanos tholiformis]|uniref:phosphoribosylaminoimidazole carboxylase n=1 Tax=Cyclostephanos tholiformis TaxID=382380 RepID=A0ABD3R7P1_9STRA